MGQFFETESFEKFVAISKTALAHPILGMTHYDIHSGVGGRGVPLPRYNKGYKRIITDCKVIVILHSVGLTLVS